MLARAVWIGFTSALAVLFVAHASQELADIDDAAVQMLEAGSEAVMGERLGLGGNCAFPTSYILSDGSCSNECPAGQMPDPNGPGL